MDEHVCICTACVNAAEDKLSFIEACKSGNLITIRTLLENKVDANCKDDNRKTPLMHASENGHLEIVKLLLQYGAPKVHSRSKTLDGWTSLHFVCVMNHVTVVRFLLFDPSLDPKPDPNAKDNLALKLAASKGHVGVVRLLLKALALASKAPHCHGICVNTEKLLQVKGLSPKIQLLLRGFEVCWAPECLSTEWNEDRFVDGDGVECTTTSDVINGLVHNRRPLRMCMRCFSACYCSISCQKRHWKETGINSHRKECAEITNGS